MANKQPSSFPTAWVGGGLVLLLVLLLGVLQGGGSLLRAASPVSDDWPDYGFTPISPAEAARLGGLDNPNVSLQNGQVQALKALHLRLLRDQISNQSAFAELVDIDNQILNIISGALTRGTYRLNPNIIHAIQGLHDLIYNIISPAPLPPSPAPPSPTPTV